MYMSALHGDLEADFRHMASLSTEEELPKIGSMKTIKKFINWFSPVTSYLWKLLYRSYCAVLRLDRRKCNMALVRTCVVPFCFFANYDIHPADAKKNTGDKAYNQKSHFLQLALNQHENDLFHQGNTVLEVLLQYKWKTFARSRFFWIYMLHLLYYISYSLSVLFAGEMFSYTPGTPISHEHLACIVLMFIAAAIFLLQEIHQLIKCHSLTSYIFSPYNIFDMIAITFPALTFWQMLSNQQGLVSQHLPILRRTTNFCSYFCRLK